MQRWLTTFAVLLALIVAPAAWAVEEEDDEPNAFELYLARAGTNAAAGANGLVTAPADPVAFTMDGPEIFESKAAGYIIGPFAGLCQFTYRTVMGATDIGLAILPAMPPLSPVPRYKLLPFEHPDE